MAWGAQTVLGRFNFGNKEATLVSLPGPASYATGGEAVSASQFGLGTLDCVIVVSAPLLNARYEPTTQKVVFARTGTAANADFNEVAAAQDLSSKTITLLAIGS